MLVGRGTELALLGQALDDVVAGHSRLILLSGEAGLGKTTLLRWMAEQAATKGLQVCRAAGWEAVDVPAFWIWDEVLRQLGSSIGPAVEQSDPVVVFRGIADALGRSASGPQVLILDDLHAADNDSLLALEYVTEAAPTPLLVVGAVDPQPLRRDPRKQGVIATLTRNSTPLLLAPLTSEEVYELVRRSGSDVVVGPATDAVFKATQGNPLFVHEVLRMLSAGDPLHRGDHSVGFRAPSGVSAVVLGRVSLLEPHTQEVLTVASVIGLTFEASLLQQILGTDLYTLLDRLDDAVGQGFIEEASALGAYRFVHLLVREAIYEDLSAAQRMRLHHKVALALDANDDDPAGERLQVLAHHWFKAAQAGDPKRALILGRRAAQAAAAQGAFEESERLYKRALQVTGAAAASREDIVELEEELAAVQKPTEKAARPKISVAAQDGSEFRKEGDYWTVRYEGKTSRLKDAKGLRYLSQLLRNPGREVHVLDLVAAVEHEGAPRSVRTEGLSASQSEDPMLDERAKREYRQRITELKADIEEAEDHNDSERSARARAEMEALIDHLSAALGLGGRDRSTASAAERARINVTKVVKEAIRRISSSDPALGAHLAATVRTGTYMSYTPDPRVPVRWKS